MNAPIRIAVTGAAGQLAYSLIFRLAAGEVFGPHQPIHLQLLEIPPAMKALEGVVMELEDCAYSLLAGVEAGDDPARMFAGSNWALLVGSKARGPGMERGDLLVDNGNIFVAQGKALEKAAEDIQVLVVGNPANTNCLIAMNHARGIPPQRFAAMMRLDHNRARTQLALKAGAPVSEVRNIAIWGNHSATQYPDFQNASIGGKSAQEVIKDRDWLEQTFIPLVQKRGAAIIAARGFSSAASAANAALDHVKAMITPTAPGDWFSAAICSDGSYDIPKGLIFSFPLRSDGKHWEIVQGLELDAFAQEKIATTLKELEEEKAIIGHLLAD